MAPKRYPDTPAAALSDNESEEQEDSSDEEQQQEEQSNQQNSDSEQESQKSEEDEEEQPLQQKPSVQKHSDSKSSEGSGSDSDSDNAQNSPTASAFTIKPIVFKPIKDSPKPNNPVSKSTQLKPPAKRQAEQNAKGSGNGNNKKSKVSNGDGEDGLIEEKKFAINRIWSEDDEIAVLKGMIDYKAKKGADPNSDMAAFLEFIKDSLHVDVSKNQLTDKVRRLKKKYQKNAEKGQNGEDPVFSRPHEHKSFELSKKIWGAGVGSIDDSKVKSSKKKTKKDDEVINNSVSKLVDNTNKEFVLHEEEVEDEIKEDEVKEEEKIDFWSLYPRLTESLESETSAYLSLPKGAKNFVKNYISSFGREKANQLEDRWKNITVMEYKLYTKRVELIHEQNQMMLDAMKSSKS